VHGGTSHQLHALEGVEAGGIVDVLRVVPGEGGLGGIGVVVGIADDVPASVAVVGRVRAVAHLGRGDAGLHGDAVMAGHTATHFDTADRSRLHDVGRGQVTGGRQVALHGEQELVDHLAAEQGNAHAHTLHHVAVAHQVPPAGDEVARIGS